MELERLVGGGYDLVTSRGIVRELERIAKGRSRDAGAARVALKIVKERARVVESEEAADEWLLREGEKGAVVCTNDIELIKRLGERRVKVVRVRGRARLEFAH